MLGGIPVSVLSASTLLAITVLMLLTGRLVPRIALKDKAEEAERWRKAYELERTSRNISEGQTNELLEVARTTKELIAAISTASERIRLSGGSDVFPETQDG